MQKKRLNKQDSSGSSWQKEIGVRRVKDRISDEAGGKF